MTSSNTPTLWEAMQAQLEDLVRTWFTSMPARVVSFDRATQSISAQPLIMAVDEDERGERRATALPVVNHVPVAFIGNGAGFRLNFDLSAGDTVLLVHTCASLDRWLSKGGLVDPEDPRRFDLTDAVAIPSVHDFAHALQNLTANPFIGYNGAGIEFTGSEIHAGGSSALALLDELSTLRTAFLAHIHPGGTISGNTAVTNTLVPSFAGTGVLKGS